MRRSHLPSRACRGLATVYALILLSVLAGLCSLGAEYGRVQVAKLELQRAADAAARAAALSLSQGHAAAQARNDAIAVAAQNAVDGTALTLNASDILIGNWNNGTFTNNGTPVNAVRIAIGRTAAKGNPIPLTFARVIGMNSCDISANVTATAAGVSPAGFVGLMHLTAGNNASIASYTSTAGLPGGGNVTSNGDLGSNSTVSLGQNASLRGDFVLGPSGSTSTGGNFYTTGSTLHTTASLAYAVTEAPSGTNLGAIALGNNATYTLPAGTYCASSVSAGNDCTVNGTGPVTLYVTGNVSVGNNFTVNAYHDQPVNFKLRLVGTGKTFTANNNLTLTASIYGPGFDLDTKNNAQINGLAILNSMDFGNNALLYYDTSLPIPTPSNSAGGTIQIVQ